MESEGVKQLYLLQEAKAKENYDKQVAAAREYESQQVRMRGGGAAEEEKGGSDGRDMEKGEGERMEVDHAEREAERTEGGTDVGSGITSVNVNP